MPIKTTTKIIISLIPSAIITLITYWMIKTILTNYSLIVVCGLMFILIFIFTYLKLSILKFKNENFDYRKTPKNLEK